MKVASVVSLLLTLLAPIQFSRPLIFLPIPLWWLLQ
jgi:hypothetical protein